MRRTRELRLPFRTPRFLAQLLVMALTATALTVLSAAPAAAQSWPVQGETDPATFSCDQLFHSNYRSGMAFRNDADGTATIDNTVVSKRSGTGLPDYWSTNMAAGADPDTGSPALFYSDYRSGNTKLYKQVSGTGQVTDEIYQGQTRNLPAGTNWGGLGYDARRGALYGAVNLAALKLMRMDLKTGTSQVWERADLTTTIPNDPVIANGTTIPDLFVDSDGGAYFGMNYGGTYIYRFDPDTATVTRVLQVTGPGAIGGNAYGMAYHNGAIYLGGYDGSLYRVNRDTGVSTQVAGGQAQNNQVGAVKSESGGSWPITDLASCSVAPNLTDSLTVKKSATPADAKPGDTVTYTLDVTNTGPTTYTGARLTDDLSGVVDDAAYNGDARATIAGAPAATQPSYDSGTRKLTWTGDLASGATVTLRYTVTVGSPPGGDKRLRNTATVPGSNCAAGSTDASCATDTPLALLAIEKTSTPETARPGEKVSYTLTLRNTGTAPWTGARVDDDLSGALDDATYNGDAAASGGTGQVTYAADQRRVRWEGTVPAGGTVTVTYSVTVDEPPGGDKVLRNAVTGPAGSSCAAGSADAACGTETPVEGLLVEKSATPDRVRPGDTVTYTVTAQNVGAATVTGATLTDDLSGVVDDAAYNGDARATIAGAPAATQPSYDSGTKELTWTGDIASGATVTLRYTVKVGSPPEGDKVLRNAVTSSPEESTCGADPEAICATEVPVGLLDIEKKADRSDARPGDTVTYTVTVRNTGEADYDGAAFTDDLSGVLDDATWDDAVTASSGSTDFDAGAREFTWRGDIPQGGTVTVTYRVTVGSPPQGDKVLRNAVTGPEGSTCPPGGAVPECGTSTPVGTLELAKTASPPNAKPGDRVTYTVTVRNTGQGTYRNARFTDDLTDVLREATYNDDARARGAGTATYSEPEVRWSGDLAAGETATVTYSVTLGQDASGRMRNVLVGPDGSNCPENSTDPDCASVVPVAALKIAKTSSPAAPKPGDRVTYTLTVTNTGSGTYTGARITDDLSGVLDDAEYGNDAQADSGTVGYRAPELTWTGDVTAGTPVRIVYSVTVGSPPGGDKVLRNAVTGPDGSNCPAGGSDPDCSRETPLPALKVTKTVAPREARTGERVTYTVTVENTGKAAYDGAAFTDDLSGVLDDADWNGDARATTGTLSYLPPLLRWRGDLAAGEEATVTYSVTVHNRGDKRLANVVTADGSNCAPGSTDPDCAEELETGALRLTKTAEPAQAVPGGQVTYTVTVENTGRTTYRNASFTDDLTGVLDDAEWAGEARATTGTVSYDRPLVRWSGDLAPGATARVRYTVTVGEPPGGDKVLRNAVTGPADSNCRPAPARSAAPAVRAAESCGTSTPVRMLELRKTAEPSGTVRPGDRVAYTLTMTNTGTATADPATFTDDLSGVLDDATYQRDARADRGTVTDGDERLLWRGRLAPGERVTVRYSVVVDTPPAGDRVLRNAVVTDDPGSTCRSAAEPGCSTSTEVTPGKPKPPVLPDTGTPFPWFIAALTSGLLAAGGLVFLLARRRS